MHIQPSSIFQGGFADAVFDAQAVFRGVMDATANPGRIVDLGAPTAAPAPLNNAASDILAALADYDTPIWIEATDHGDAAAWLAFHTGAPVITDRAQADFAVLRLGSEVEGWQRFAIGTSSYPDRSATLILPVSNLTGGEKLTLRGPGIETSAMLAPAGLPQGFTEMMARNAALFPLGWDVILVAEGQIAALPRTTRVTGEA